MTFSNNDRSIEIEHLLRQGTLLNNDERFDAARPYFLRALDLATQRHGPFHERTQEARNSVALCDFNRADYVSALAHYRSLLGSLLRCYSKDDLLVKITESNILRCQVLVRGSRKFTIAETVFRSFFAHEEDYAVFNIEHDVTVTFGERLDPEGSWLSVGRPTPEFPSSVEHMPGGVQCGDKTWTLQIRWLQSDGSYVIERRNIDGSVEHVRS